MLLHVLGLAVMKKKKAYIICICAHLKYDTEGEVSKHLHRKAGVVAPSHSTSFL